MNFKGALTGAVAALVLVHPLAAQNEYKSYEDYCTVGSLNACASVSISSEGNVLKMKVWNLEGSLGSSYTMTAIGLYHLGNPWSGTVQNYAVDYNGTDITSKWASNKAQDINNLGGITLELKEGTTGNAGIIGCVDPGGSPDKWKTCNSFDQQPYVQFTFNLSSHFALGTAEMRYHAQQVGPDQISLKCDTGNPNGCAYTTPEPVTMVLLGSGLAGVGAAAARRRKRKAGEIETV